MTSEGCERTFVIYGAGGLARELAWLVERAVDKGLPWRVATFADDRPEHQGTVINGCPVSSFEQAAESHASAHWLVGVGAPAARKRLADRIRGRGLATATLIHPDTFWSKWNSIGEGSVVQVACHVTVNVTVGRHVLINGNLSIGHDVRIGDYSTLGPGCNISGHVRIGQGVVVGTGATIREGSADAPLEVGDGAVIAAGACVLRSVAAGEIMMGVPARPRTREQT